IVNGINEEEISRDTSLFGSISEYRYRILKDTVIQEVYYRYGDEFRVEQVSFDTLLAFAKLLNKHISIKEGTRISFFSWDAIFYNRLSKDEYNQIYSALTN
ncbi:MAG: hypothetical protein WCH34_08180, partial [Bacteroidota bacterium]